MKALIVDDNVAVQEIIRDILAERGHIVRLASTVEEAVEKIKSFEPDVVMLDSQVGEEDGLHVIPRVREELSGFDLRVVLIKGPGDTAPTDIPEIKEVVDKPFKSAEILEALDSLKVSEAEAEVAAEAGRRKKKKAKRQGGRLRRGKAAPQEPVPDLTESGIVFGRSYVVFEPEPDRIYSFTAKFCGGEHSVLVVTTSKAKAIRERFSYDDIEVLPLTTSGRAGSEDIRSLGSVMVSIKEFAARSERPVVVFDSFGEIIAADGLNASLTMLQQLMQGVSCECTFAVSVDGTPLTDKDRGILLHNMVEYDRD